MYGFLVFGVLLIIIYILGKYTNLQRDEDNTFLLRSSVLFVLLFILFYHLLLNPNITDTSKMNDIFMDHKSFILVIAYMLWFFTSTVINHRFNTYNTAIPFYSGTNPTLQHQSVLYQ